MLSFDLPVVRPRRSVLYVPGANRRALERAATLPIDGAIFDLEDAVAPAQKAVARDHVGETLRAHDFGRRERAIRVNALASAWGADDLRFCASLARDRWDALVLPKVESAAEVAAARAFVAADVPVWCMIETPRGVLAAAEIAAAPGVVGLVMGTSDLSKDLGIRPMLDRLPLLFALSQVLLAARAAGAFALDGVCLELADDGAFEREAGQGAALGFDGKTLIHPKTVAAANRIFAPDSIEIAQAERVVAAFQAAQAEGHGVVVVDSRLVENLHVTAALRRLALAQAIQREL